MTTIVTIDGYSYSIEEGWQGYEDPMLFEYGFAPELPGVSIYRSVKTGDKRPIVGSAVKSAIFAGSINAMVYALDKQLYRSMSSIAFEAIVGSTPAQVMSSVAPVAAVAAISVAASSAYISGMKQLEPEGNVHDKASYWRGISAALTGGFGGISIA